MRLFWELVLTSFHRQLAYRAAILAGLATNFFFGLLRLAVLVALFGDQIAVEGVSKQAAITYTGLAQAMIGFLSLFSWYELMNTIYTGGIASDLLKPMGYFTYWLGQDVGRALAQLIMRGLPIMAAYAIFFGIVTPNSPAQWVAVVISLVLALLVSFSWRFLVNLAAFWYPNALGIGRLAFTLSLFLSGFLMPLRFFPDWFQRICAFTPFPYTINTVVEVYLGVLPRDEVILSLALQLIWAIILMLAGQIVLRAGIRKLVILGC